MLDKVSLRRGNIELRTVNQSLTLSGDPETAEIVKWTAKGDGSEYCFTLCYWVRHGEGYDLRFVGNRPTGYADPSALWGLIVFGQNLLDDYFERTD